MLKEVSLKTIAIILVCMILVSAGVVAFIGVKATIERNAASKTTLTPTTTITAKTTTTTTTKTSKTTTNTSSTVPTSTNTTSIEDVLTAKKFVNSRNDDQYFTFVKDGNCTEWNKGIPYSGKWQIEGNFLVIKDDLKTNPDYYSLNMSGNVLISFTLGSDTFYAQ